ncbi:connector enhancer of kinase suppressor of ras 1 [Electrophorus electricus]|uniref:connector enhancer of kinase suppressor of ras 1 n=1 Tax=Electrophorus electricus TaxID=8005 RepID=UPI0015D0B97F|nr:connector enhancer of kinase suppressor of ras 1 [Electrophorus electricus]
MDPVTSWSAESVSRWLRGLDSSLQQYAFEQWQLSGVDLLQLSSQQLHQLGVHKLGHQELVLEAVEKLCSLTYGLGGESLRSLTEKLRAVAHSLQMGIQSRWRVNTYDGQSATKLPASVLQDVVELITAAKGLFFLLNRYQHTQISGCTGSQNIIPLCKDLGSTIHKEITVFEKEKDIIATSRQLVAICDEILSSAPEGLLTHATQLQSVELVPTIPGQQLGLEITSTPSNQHYVSSTAEKCPSESSKILAGDEVIQVNDQIVVGWSRKYLEEKLQESPHGISLLLRRMPFSLRRRDERGDSSVSIKRSNKPIEFSFSPGEEKVSEEEQEERGRHAVLTHTPASVRCCSYRAAVLTPEGQELSERVSDYSFDGSQSFTSSTDQQREGSETGLVRRGLGEEPSTMRRSPSPLSLDSNRVRMGSCPEMGGNREEKENKKYTIKGTQTALSRRRVSCRELGRPDCDGWLWKKRKESSVFMTQKWQRFWFVLKGATIYWYTSQQEEKAVGLVKIGSYSIESAGEHKRKYVFKMSHPRFQNFFFAADNVTDMSKWINSLITAIQKYRKFQQNLPDSEAECYSETESEEDGSNSPRLPKKKASTKVQSNTLPRKSKPKGGGATTTLPAGGSKAAGAEDEMGDLFNKLKEGGVSLIGQSQPITHDQLRRSFIRRNKNPVINEKIHTLRALQSTLKAKEAELQIINKLLEDSELTSLKFLQWKQCNEELYQEIQKLSAERNRHQTAPPPMAVAGGDSRVYDLSLSDGEQLVDSDVPSDGDSTLVTGHAHSGYADVHGDQTESGSSDKYFYI